MQQNPQQQPQQQQRQLQQPQNPQGNNVQQPPNNQQQQQHQHQQQRSSSSRQQGPQQQQQGQPQQQQQRVIKQENRDQQKDIRQQLQQIYEKQNAYEFDEELFKIAPELNVLQKLIDYESTIDKMIKRKRFDMQEQFAKPIPQLKHVLRLALSHQFVTEDGQLSMDPTHWIIKLEGKVLSNNIELNGKYRSHKFTQFFSKIELSVDPDIYPNLQNIHWEKKENPQDVDCVMIKREGNKECDICIDLHLQHNPPQYKIKKELAQLVGKSLCTRSYVLASIWEYIKLNNLQDRDNKSQINNDESLREIFGCDKMMIGTITQRLRDMLEIDDPLQIRHSMKLGQDKRFFDIEVNVPYEFGLEIMPFLSQKVVIDEKKEQVTHPFMQLNQKIKKLEKKSLEQLERLKSHKYKRDSYLAYSLQPSLYIENILIQQNQLLKIMKSQPKKQFNDPTKLSYLVENEEDVMDEIKAMLEEQIPSQSNLDPQLQQQQQPQPQQQPQIRPEGTQQFQQQQVQGQSQQNISSAI